MGQRISAARKLPRASVLETWKDWLPYRLASHRRDDKRGQIRLVKRNGSYNIVWYGSKWSSLVGFMVEINWFWFLLLVMGYYLTVHFTFSGFYAAAGHDSIVNSKTYADYFFFSVQTMETIGYGYMAPVKISSNSIMVVQVFFGALFGAFIVAMFVARLTRPSHLRSVLLFSDGAVVNYQQTRYVGPNVDTTERGRYQHGVPFSELYKERPFPPQFPKPVGASSPGSVEREDPPVERLNMSPPGKMTPEEEDDATCPCLVFRVGNPHRTQLLNSRVRMFLFRRKLPMWGEFAIKPSPSQQQEMLGIIDPDFADDFVIEELSFEIYRQNGRIRALDTSGPSLGLPWTVTHPMNRYSPLKDATPATLEAMEAEIIITVDGVHEGLGVNVQSRWSYLPREIIWNARFVPIVHLISSRRKFFVDYSRLSAIVRLEDLNAVSPSSSPISRESSSSSPKLNRAAPDTDRDVEMHPV